MSLQSKFFKQKFRNVHKNVDEIKDLIKKMTDNKLEIELTLDSWGEFSSDFVSIGYDHPYGEHNEDFPSPDDTIQFHGTKKVKIHFISVLGNRFTIEEDMDGIYFDDKHVTLWKDCKGQNIEVYSFATRKWIWVNPRHNHQHQICAQKELQKLIHHLNTIDLKFLKEEKEFIYEHADVLCPQCNANEK